MAEINIYENRGGVESIVKENEEGLFYKVSKITVEGGLKQWIDGAEYPRKGYCPPEAMFACNQAKRIFVEGLKMFNSWQFITAIIFTKDKMRFIRSYNEIVWKVMAPFITKYEYLTSIAQDLQDLTYSMMIKLGLDEENSKRFAKIFSHLIEYDDAYRFRVQDILNETRKDFIIERPITEVDRLTLLLTSRDSPGVAEKFQKLSKLLCIALCLPSVRNAFREVVEESNFKKLQVDDSDFYWHCFREDYKFGGMTNDDRKEYLKIMNWKIPEKIKI